MKKIISTVFCICFFAFANAQTNTIKAADTFLEKVNNKLSTIKAAEYSMIDKTGNSKPEIFTSSGYFEKVPSDTLIGCKVFIKTEFGTSILYDGVNRYNMSNDTLRIVNELRFSKIPQLTKRPQLPTFFNDVLKKFMLVYGTTPEMVNYNIKNSFLKTNVAKVKKDNVVYHTISSEIIFKKEPLEKVTATLYTTEDYLPLKVITTAQMGKTITKEECFIEKYKLLESMPEGSFSPEVLGNPSVKQIITDFDKSYYFKKAERFSLDKN